MGKYHVVCHGCPTERVLDEEQAARSVRVTHEEETGHRVSCEEIQVPVSEA